MEFGWSHRRPAAAFSSMVQRVIEAGAAPRLSGSGALGFADVAAGRSDAYVELHINLWDVAAALALLREAGAHVSRSWKVTVRSVVTRSWRARLGSRAN